MGYYTWNERPDPGQFSGGTASVLPRPRSCDTHMKQALGGPPGWARSEWL